MPGKVWPDYNPATDPAATGRPYRVTVNGVELEVEVLDLGVRIDPVNKYLTEKAAYDVCRKAYGLFARGGLREPNRSYKA